MRNGNRTAGLGRRVPDHVQVQLTRHDLKHERKSTEDGVTHEFTVAELDLIRHVMPAQEVGHSDAKRWVDENRGDV